jgi:hypothetical protein
LLDNLCDSKVGQFEPNPKFFRFRLFCGEEKIASTASRRSSTHLGFLFDSLQLFVVPVVYGMISTRVNLSMMLGGMHVYIVAAVAGAGADSFSVQDEGMGREGKETYAQPGNVMLNHLANFGVGVDFLPRSQSVLEPQQPLAML